MRDVCSLIWLALIGLFRLRASLQAEILTLRHQFNVLRRKLPQRLTFSSIDRLVFAGLHRLAPGILDAFKIVRPETVIRWLLQEIREFGLGHFPGSHRELAMNRSRPNREETSVQEMEAYEQIAFEPRRNKCVRNDAYSALTVRDPEFPDTCKKFPVP